MKRLRAHKSFLHLLVHTHPKQRTALIRTSTPEQLGVLSEILLNIMREVLPISAKHRQQLMKYKDTLRLLVRKKLSNRAKRELLAKYRDFIPTLFAPVYPLLEELLDGLTTGAHKDVEED